MKIRLHVSHVHGKWAGLIYCMSSTWKLTSLRTVRILAGPFYFGASLAMLAISAQDCEKSCSHMMENSFSPALAVVFPLSYLGMNHIGSYYF